MKRILLILIIIESLSFTHGLVTFAESNFVEKDENSFLYNLSAISFVDETDFTEAQDWWLLYEDPDLNQIIEKVIKNNLDHKMALNRLNASYFLAKASHGKEFPQISLNNQYIGQRTPKNLTVPSISRLNSAGPRVFAPGKWVNIYNLPLNLSYEPDLFLRNHLRTKSKRLEAEAAAYEVELSRLNIIYKTTEIYFNLNNLNEQINIQKQLISISNRNLELSKDLERNGLKNKIELNYLEEDLQSQELSLADLIQEKNILISELALLMGEKPYISDTYHQIENISEPYLKVNNLTSELLYNRPDIKVSEKLLASSDIDIKLARKAYLPSFSLSVQSGLSSIDISNLVSPESFLVALVAGITQSIFTAGSREAELNYAKAKNQELLNSHSKTILSALKEAELNLKDFSKTENKLVKSLQIKDSAQKRLILSNDKFKQGLISEIDLNLKRQEALKATASSLKLKTQKLISFSSLAKSLGGKIL